MRRSCSFLQYHPTPCSNSSKPWFLHLHHKLTIPYIISVSLTWPGPENFHVLIPKLSPAQKLSHICKHSGKSGEGKRRRRRKRRGQLPTEVNPVTHSDCGHEHVSRQKWERGKDMEGKERKERTEGEKARNSAGKACFLSWCEGRERKETDGAWCYPSPFFFPLPS